MLMGITHDELRKRFEVEIDGFTAYVAYETTEAGEFDILHTIVPKEIGGRGIASALVKTAYDYAIEKKLKPIAACSYAVKWLEKHPEYNETMGM